jgi:hypothetical protein
MSVITLKELGLSPAGMTKVGSYTAYPENRSFSRTVKLYCGKGCIVVHSFYLNAETSFLIYRKKSYCKLTFAEIGEVAKELLSMLRNNNGIVVHHASFTLDRYFNGVLIGH